MRHVHFRAAAGVAGPLLAATVLATTVFAPTVPASAAAAPGAEIDRNLERAAAGAAEIGSAGRDIGGTEIHLPGDKLSDAVAAAIGVVVDPDVDIGLLVGGKCQVEEWRVEGGPGAGELREGGRFGNGGLREACAP